MARIDELNVLFTNYAPLIQGLVSILGILGGICGGILSVLVKLSTKRLKKKVEDSERREAKLIEQINELTMNNSQMANTINNYGLSLNEIKDVVNELTDKKLEHVSNFYYEQEPEKERENTVWIGE